MHNLNRRTSPPSRRLLLQETHLPRKSHPGVSEGLILPMNVSSKRPRPVNSDEEEEVRCGAVSKVSLTLHGLSSVMLTSSFSETMLATSPDITILFASKVL